MSEYQGENAEPDRVWSPGEFSSSVLAGLGAPYEMRGDLRRDLVLKDGALANNPKERPQPATIHRRVARSGPQGRSTRARPPDGFRIEARE